ncbi:MAG: hypothetical protein ABIV11_11020, partial [Gemmatimonadaceae bacterium]
MSIRFARPLWRLSVACCLMPTLPGVARAQVPQREIIACSGQVITAIEVDTRPPFSGGDGNIIARTGQVARKLHSTTRPETVRRYLALQLGDRCDELRRAESER